MDYVNKILERGLKLINNDIEMLKSREAYLKIDLVNVQKELVEAEESRNQLLAELASRCVNVSQ